MAIHPRWVGSPALRRGPELPRFGTRRDPRMNLGLVHGYGRLRRHPNHSRGHRPNFQPGCRDYFVTWRDAPSRRCHTGHIRPSSHTLSTALTPTRSPGPPPGVTSRSGGTRPPAASVSRARHSSSARVSSGGGPSSTVTTQSWQASPRTRQVSQSILVVMPLHAHRAPPTTDAPSTTAVGGGPGVSSPCVGGRSYRPPHEHHRLPTPLGGPAHLRRARPAAARPDLLRGRPRDHRRLGRGRLDDHRDRRGQGARRRGARRVPDPGQPAHRRSRRSSRCSPASPTPWSATRRRSSRRCRRSSSSPRARCWSPTTRRSTSASSSASRPGRACPGRRSRCSTPPSSRAGSITRDDAPNCKLSSLAKAFHATTTPNHRALSDARATVDVLHGLMERLGGLGVHTLEELQTFSARCPTAQRRKRHLAEGLPHAPGVYLFRDDRARVLYVGTSRDLRTRVRSYFTASETRSRMGEMVGLADVRHRHRVRDPARGRGARAAPDRRAQAALQPALPVPREGPLPQADPRALAAAVAGAPRASTTTPTTSARSRQQAHRREVPGRAARDLPGPPVHRPARPAAVACRRACSPRWAAASSPCDGSVDATTYAAVVRQLRDTLLQPARRRGRG